jgi:tetratricopeptide (TPR) repeat protein
MTDAIAISSRRRLLLRDGMTFLVLTLGTAVLFGLTWLLFQSFTAHRADLAQRWAGRGRVALAQGRAQDAVEALRTALTYSPGERDYELMLAEALEGSGHTEEATNYFLNLWEAQPGDGVINLELARLARKKRDRNEAVRYYQASVDGSWEGDGVEHRRDARLELANYLIEQKDFATAQTELLIAGSNAPPDASLELMFGDELVRAEDDANALSYYQKAIKLAPRNALAYEKAGRLAYRMGDYARAVGWLEKAVRESAGGLASSGGAAEEDDLTLLKNAERLQVLAPTAARTEQERIARELVDKAIAKRRFDTCSAQLGRAYTAMTPGAVKLPAEVQALSARWAAASGLSTQQALAADDANEDTVTALIDDSEELAARVCGAPKGDDALLLMLAEGRR